MDVEGLVAHRGRRQPSSRRSTLPTSLRGQRVDAMERHRHLVGREVLAAQLALGRRRRRAASADDEGDGHLAETLVGETDHGDVVTRAGARSTSSTSSGTTLLPPRLITSPMRPSIHTKPSSSIGRGRRCARSRRRRCGRPGRRRAASPAATGGRTSSSPTPSGRASSMRTDTPGCARPTAPSFSGCSLASAAVQPIDLAHLGLPVAVEHRDAEAVA